MKDDKLAIRDAILADREQRAEPPKLRCEGCGRETVQAGALYCNMIQPDGRRCPGEFRPIP